VFGIAPSFEIKHNKGVVIETALSRNLTVLGQVNALKHWALQPLFSIMLVIGHAWLAVGIYYDEREQPQGLRP
jgi:hypothetical protein